jgi:hypothetical protein
MGVGLARCKRLGRSGVGRQRLAVVADRRREQRLARRQRWGPHPLPAPTWRLVQNTMPWKAGLSLGEEGGRHGLAAGVVVQREEL